MMCYRDMTFCKFYVLCEDGDTCHRALTPQVLKQAHDWWGSDEAPICEYADLPGCFNLTRDDLVIPKTDND